MIEEQEHTFLFYIQVDTLQKQVDKFVVSSGLAHISNLTTNTNIPLFITDISGEFDNNYDDTESEIDAAKKLRKAIQDIVKMVSENNGATINITNWHIYKLMA